MSLGKQLNLKLRPDQAQKQEYLKILSDKNEKQPIIDNTRNQIPENQQFNPVLGYSINYKENQDAAPNVNNISKFQMVRSNYLDKSGQLHHVIQNQGQLFQSLIESQKINNDNQNQQIYGGIVHPNIIYQQAGFNRSLGAEVQDNIYQDPNLQISGFRNSYQDNIQFSRNYFQNFQNFMTNSHNLFAVSKIYFDKNPSRVSDIARSIQNSSLQPQIFDLGNRSLIDSQIQLNQQVRSDDDMDIYESNDQSEKQQLNGDYPKSANTLGENCNYNTENNTNNDQQQPTNEKNDKREINLNNSSAKLPTTNNTNTNITTTTTNTNTNDQSPSNAFSRKIKLVYKEDGKKPRQKSTQDNKYRQSKHKNVFKNFGCTLIRFIMYNQHFQDKLSNEIFKSDIQSKNHFQDWLQYDAKLENKTLFIRAFTVFKQDSDQIKNYKWILKNLALDFYENFSLIYLMNSSKISNFEIHLRSIHRFILALNKPEFLEKFVPVKFEILRYDQ